MTRLLTDEYLNKDVWNHKFWTINTLHTCWSDISQFSEINNT